MHGNGFFGQVYSCETIIDPGVGIAGHVFVSGPSSAWPNSVQISTKPSIRVMRPYSLSMGPTNCSYSLETGSKLKSTISSAADGIGGIDPSAVQ